MAGTIASLRLITKYQVPSLTKYQLLTYGAYS
jgi:hypothetical protein